MLFQFKAWFWLCGLLQNARIDFAFLVESYVLGASWLEYYIENLKSWVSFFSVILILSAKKSKLELNAVQCLWLLFSFCISFLHSDTYHNVLPESATDWAIAYWKRSCFTQVFKCIALKYKPFPCRFMDGEEVNMGGWDLETMTRAVNCCLRKFIY
jgi:hypothetical protein